MEFLPINLALYHEYERIRKETPVHSADYTFTNIWGWADLYGLSIALEKNYAIIHQSYPFECFWAPVGDWYSMNFEEIFSSIKSKLFNKNASVTSHENIIDMHRVPKELLGLMQTVIKKPIQIFETRGQWEYLYNRDDLANLSGNRFHKKKNHVNAFYKNYGEDYRTFDATGKNSCIIEDVLLLQEEWCRWRDCENSPSLQAENDVIFRVVGNWAKLGNLVGGALYVEDSIVAFSIGEPVNDDTFVVHFEKTQPDYKGVYQAINNAFVRHATENYTIINREQDMDELGLRQAKETYNPTGFIEKSRLVIALEKDF